MRARRLSIVRGRAVDQRLTIRQYRWRRNIARCGEPDVHARVRDPECNCVHVGEPIAGAAEL